MDTQHLPYRSEVGSWTPDDLADYFRRLNYKDCEKVVRKHSITGQRFLNMSENDIQKFPKLRMPILSRLSMDINRNEERRSIFQKRTYTQKVPQNTGLGQEEGDSWSSFESDDYECPDDQEAGVDYETPNDDDGVEDENDGDYEPPPSNDDETHRNAIFPSKSIPTPSEYIDRAAPVKTSLQPPVPPQRSIPSPTPVAHRGRGAASLFASPSSNESNKEKNIKMFKPPIDRTKKPPLNQSGPPFDRELLGGVQRGMRSEMTLTPQLRFLGEELAKIQKPPVPSNEKHEKHNPASRRMPPPIQNSQTSERKEVEDVNIFQRPVPQPPLQFFNTFPSRSTKPVSKQSPLPPMNIVDAHAESTVSSSGSLPPRLQPSNICRTFSKGQADSRPPLPVLNRQSTRTPNTEYEKEQEFSKASLNYEWYAADITRVEAEGALRTINQDGTFLVRNSSRKTVEQPYVLMVLFNDKVYNLQIRYHLEDQTYFLGTGLRGNEDFTSVGDIIDYFTKAPLRLIDGKDRGSRQQCTLTYAAGAL
ncbi:lymphocyte cytosolic protein 2 [Sphaerodactylus townsendi]|uniref:lymphocyte cytosolic protein 2 n=1 Tax=Sphaerodactylus townsendi TaxID=933632 RepID=UPI0020260279|nr:lymphocyte cytosolic protein 2 [Sphaerodactylus townsendi]